MSDVPQYPPDGAIVNTASSERIANAPSQEWVVRQGCWVSANDRGDRYVAGRLSPTGQTLMQIWMDSGEPMAEEVTP